MCIYGSPNVQPGDTDSLTCQLCGDLIRGVCSHDRIGRRCHWGCAAKYAERKDEEMLAAAQRRYECYVVEGWSGRRTPLVLHWIGNVPDLLHNPLLGSRKGFLRSATQQASARARKDFSLLSEDLLDSRLEWTLVYWSGPNGLIYWSCLLYTSPSPRDLSTSRMPSSA